MMISYQVSKSLLAGNNVSSTYTNQPITLTLSYGNPRSLPRPFIFRDPLKKGNHLATLLIQLSDCLAFRFSVLSFFSHASITHDEKLELSRSTLVLISSINSCGKRIFFLAVLLVTFWLDIVITLFLVNNVRPIYNKTNESKTLDMCAHIIIACAHKLNFTFTTKTKPHQCWNTNRASNHNVIRGNTMAMYKSTQTHPKLTFYFLAVRRADLCAKPCRQSITAIDERAARKMLVAEYVLFFAGRIPAEAVAHG